MMMKKTHHRILPYILLIITSVLPAISTKAQQGKFHRFTEDKGLSHSVINCIFQDNRGFIWIGSQDGLNKYDGYEFTIYKSVEGEEITLSGNYVNHIIYDDDVHLWIATENGGISKYDRTLNRFQQLPLITLPDSQLVTSIKYLQKDLKEYLN